MSEICFLPFKIEICLSDFSGTEGDICVAHINKTHKWLRKTRPPASVLWKMTVWRQRAFIRLERAQWRAAQRVKTFRGSRADATRCNRRDFTGTELPPACWSCTWCKCWSWRFSSQMGTVPCSHLTHTLWHSDWLRCWMQHQATLPGEELCLCLPLMEDGGAGYSYRQAWTGPEHLLPSICFSYYKKAVFIFLH